MLKFSFSRPVIVYNVDPDRSVLNLLQLSNYISFLSLKVDLIFANSADLDNTLHLLASHLGLLCLPFSYQEIVENYRISN